MARYRPLFELIKQSALVNPIKTKEDRVLEACFVSRHA
jgi:hypothetical protein